jgi:hypothetical protein
MENEKIALNTLLLIQSDLDTSLSHLSSLSSLFEEKLSVDMAIEFQLLRDNFMAVLEGIRLAVDTATARMLETPE